jgi:hypothetical protein
LGEAGSSVFPRAIIFVFRHKDTKAPSVFLLLTFAFLLTRDSTDKTGLFTTEN